MSLIFATQLTAVATAVLAVFAMATAVLAALAFTAQSREVRAIERQVKDQQEVTRQQAGMLSVQSGQLELQRQQLDDQREANARQAEVLELQANELRESLSQRKREAELRHRDQATRIFVGETRQDPKRGQPSTFRLRTGKPAVGPAVLAFVKNTSGQPVYDVELRWHRGSEGHGEPNPEPFGTLMPGEERVSVREFPPGTNLAASGAILRFRDAAGIRWIRRPDGGLSEQP